MSNFRVIDPSVKTKAIEDVRSNGPAYYADLLSPSLTPAANAIFEEVTSYGTTDVMLGDQTQVSDLSEVFCTSARNIYITPRAQDAISSLQVAGINVPLANGLS